MVECLVGCFFFGGGGIVIGYFFWEGGGKADLHGIDLQVGGPHAEKIEY
jgi:hypothetical protein